MVVRPWATPALEFLCCIDDYNINYSNSSLYERLLDDYMIVSTCSAAASIAISALIFGCFIYRRAKYNDALPLGAQKGPRRVSYGATSRTRNDALSNISYNSADAATPSRPDLHRHFALRMRISLAVAHQTGFGRAHSILLWLFLSDFLAVLIVLIRGAVWYSHVLDVPEAASIHGDPDRVEPNKADFIVFEVFCITTSFCIQFFYTATFFWSIVFAYDTLRLFESRRALECTYHVVVWCVTGSLVVIGFGLLYLPDLHTCNDGPERFVPHSATSSVPLLAALVVVPLLCRWAVPACERRLTTRSSEFQSVERSELERIRFQLWLAASTLYVCWLPNILYWITLTIQIILMNTDAQWNEHAVGNVLAGCWIAMAVTNPLQAALNMLVYSGAARAVIKRIVIWIKDCKDSRTVPRILDYDRLSASGQSPLSESASTGTSHVDFGLARRGGSLQPKGRIVHDLDDYFAEST